MADMVSLQDVLAFFPRYLGQVSFTVTPKGDPNTKVGLKLVLGEVPGQDPAKPVKRELVADVEYFYVDMTPEEPLDFSVSLMMGTDVGFSKQKVRKDTDKPLVRAFMRTIDKALRDEYQKKKDVGEPVKAAAEAAEKAAARLAVEAEIRKLLS